MILISQQQISQISNNILISIPDILDKFNIQYRETSTRFFFPCPIHDGDNQDACTIYKNSGIWNCHTNLCHEKYKKTILGFVRGLLCKKNHRNFSFDETLKFCCKIINHDIINDVNNAEYDKYKELKKYDKILDIFNKNIEIKNDTIEPIDLSKLNIPSQYFIKRGFLEKTLERFQVGECYEKNSSMFHRAIVPIYDKDNKYVGCTGRATSDNFKPKWINSKNFNKTSYLYGLNFALEDIKKTGKLFIVEGPGDLWKMYEAGYNNTCAILGAALTESQFLILENLPIFDLIIGTDPNNAGENVAAKIVEQCGRRFNYKRLLTRYTDIGETPTKEIQHMVEIL